MRPLENPPENPCFGCGPGHDRGLGLSFARGEDDEGAFVACEHTPADDEIGWPGFLHGGLHFAILYEASYWTALTLGPAVMTNRGALTFEERIVPRVGRSLEARGRIVQAPKPSDEGDADGSGAGGTPGDGSYVVRATSTGDDGRVLGVLEGTWRPASRERVERAGIELPDYLRDELAP